MTLYTGAGDAGETSLAGGDRVSKADARVEAYGEIDEASSAIGLAAAAAGDEALLDLLGFAQQRLTNCAAVVAGPSGDHAASAAKVSEEDVRGLERAIDRLEAASPPLREFVLPGGSDLAARLQVARCAVRRAERRVVATGFRDRENAQILRFLNRLSDALFAAARASLAAEGISDTVWDKAALPPD